MGHGVEMDPDVRRHLSAQLAVVGQDILDCERALREAGFLSCDFYNDMYRSLADDPAELADFERHRGDYASKVLSTPDYGRPVENYGSLHRKLEDLRKSDADGYEAFWERIRARTRELMREDARRFAVRLDGDWLGPKEDRVRALKQGGARFGMTISKTPGLAELRPVFGLQIRHGVSIVAALSGAASVYEYDRAIVDWRVGLMALDIQSALKQRFTSRQFYVPIAVHDALHGLRLSSCSSLDEIQAAAGAVCVVLRWCADRMAAMD